LLLHLSIGLVMWHELGFVAKTTSPNFFRTMLQREAIHLKVFLWLWCVVAQRMRLLYLQIHHLWVLHMLVSRVKLLGVVAKRFAVE